MQIGITFSQKHLVSYAEMPIFALVNIKYVANIHKNIVTCKKFNIFFVILHKKVRHTIKTVERICH